MDITDYKKNNSQNKNSETRNNNNRANNKPGETHNRTNESDDENSEIGFKPAKPFEIDENWTNQAKELKAKFPKLTDEDLQFEPGKENELLTRIGLKLNLKRSELISIIQKGQKKEV